MENQKLGQSEYEEVLLDNISMVVINRNYIKENLDFWNNIVFKMFEEYYFSSEEISIRTQARFLEIFFDCNIKFKPAQELPNDVLDLNR
jgi:hypothetical protein